MFLARRIGLAGALLLGACGGDEGGGGRDPEPPIEDGCELPNRLVGEACLAPGVQDDGCPAGTLGLEDGSCRPPGILEGECGEGFVHDGDVGCEPVLPAEPCPDGLMAVPGESECHPVMDCGSGTWGNIAVDDTTQYVDQSFDGVSDGSTAAPWTTIYDGILHSPTDGLIAIAAGSYVEDLTLDFTPRRLHGVCPQQVELVGSSAQIAALRILDSDGTEVRGLAIRGDAFGIYVGGSEDVLLEHLHVHDTVGIGVTLQDTEGATEATLRSSLFERNQGGGIALGSSAITIEDTLVRDGDYLAQGNFVGRGLRFVGNQESDVPSTAIVRRTLIERTQGAGVYFGGAEGQLESVVVRDSVPSPNEDVARGITLQDRPGDGYPSVVSIRGSLVERTSDDGIFVGGSEVSIEATVVRDTQVGTDSGRGRGITIGSGVSAGEPSTATITGSLVEGNHFEGIAAGGEVTIIATVARDTFPGANGSGGRGITVMHNLLTGAPSHGTIRASAVSGSREVGVLLAGSEVTVDGLAIADTAASPNGLFGDGLLGIHQGFTATFAISASWIDDSTRAGLGSFGAQFSLATTAIGCAAFPLAGEVLSGEEYGFADAGNNSCGCPGEEQVCKVVSAGLEPPDALEDTAP